MSGTIKQGLRYTIIVLASALAACGYKDALYLPDDAPDASHSSVEATTKATDNTIKSTD